MATNTYGFDFLKSQHKLDDTTTNDQVPSNEGVVTSGGGSPMIVDSSMIANAHNKPDLEKQFDILAFLQKHRDSCLAPSLIYRATGIDLQDDGSTALTAMLQQNPKIRTEFIPDPENPALQIPHYAYSPKYASVRDRTTLLAQVNRMMYGVPLRDLLDSYDTALDDIQALIVAGDVIAIQNTEDKDKILFPRGEAFAVFLDGLVHIPGGGGDDDNSSTVKKETAPAQVKSNGNSNNNNNNKKSPKMEPSIYEHGRVFGVETDVDPRTQIRRGEAVQVGGQWFRVSSAVKPGVPLSEQPARAQAPLSVVSLTDMSDRNLVDGYTRPFTNKILPLDDALSPAAQDNVKAARRAREKVLQLAHGSGTRGSTSGSVTGQLTGSYAHASNPTALATSFATAAPVHHRKRPHVVVKQQAHQANINNNNAADHTASAAARPSKAELLQAASDPALALYSHPRRHGCTRDVREMYLKTRSAVPASDHELNQVLVQHKLLEPNEQMRRPRLAKSGGGGGSGGSNFDNDGKPKKRRYYERKNQRMTNTHLEGTEIGAILMRAAEKQKQGKSVGDGGM